MAFYDFSYDINFDSCHPPIPRAQPYVVHRQPVKGVSNVREIKDNPDAGTSRPPSPSTIRTFRRGRDLTPTQLARALRPVTNRATRCELRCRPSSSMPTCISTA